MPGAVIVQDLRGHDSVVIADELDDVLYFAIDLWLKLGPSV